MADQPQRHRRKKVWLIRTVALLFLIYLATFMYGLLRPLPTGVDFQGPWRSVADLQFHADSTWLDVEGSQHNERQIFDAAFAMIERAENLIVTDFFLVNSFAGQAGEGFRPLSTQLIDALVAEKRSHDRLEAVLITDPFNDLYDGVQQPLFQQLERAGIQVVETDLRRLRDSNPTWSAAWRICCQWFDNGHDGGWLPNPVGEGAVTLRTYLALLNFKANHRKTLAVHGTAGWEGLVTSANPHDASSRHDNIAFSFGGPAVLDLLATERSVIEFSAERPVSWPVLPAVHTPDSQASLRILTEAAIRDAALEMLESARRGDSVDLLMFYLSHRDIVRGLIEAHQRGAELRVLLDPNEDAFGRKKNGIPNRQVAWELHEAGVPVRWCNTRGEQCHGKMLVVRPRSGPHQILAGSANFTRRNLDNYNLETNVQFRADGDAGVMRSVRRFFEERWSNTSERIHSLPYERHADHSSLRYWQYRLMEATGLSTF